MDPLLEKLKEKKQSVIDAISNALDAVYICVSKNNRMLFNFSIYYIY